MPLPKLQPPSESGAIGTPRPKQPHGNAVLILGLISTADYLFRTGPAVSLSSSSWLPDLQQFWNLIFLLAISRSLATGFPVPALSDRFW